jgi:predicted ATPase
MILKQKTNYFILTGTPGTGKTTLLQTLRSQGYAGIDEITREMLSHQLAIDGPGLPSKSPLRFAQMMLERSIEHFENSHSIDGSVFFDRFNMSVFVPIFVKNISAVFSELASHNEARGHL